MGANKKLNSNFNIVLITIDSLRADFLGCYNEEIRKERVSPNIDRWANEAIIFLNAITQSSHTSPAFLALLSGNYPSKYGDWYSNVSEKRLMLSEIFKSNGYYTYAFNSNPYISRYYGYNKGFDVFKDNLPKLKQGKLYKRIVIHLSRLKTLIKDPYETAPKINSQVLTYLREKSNEPFFMWIHYMDVHGPYVSKKGWTFKNRILADILWRKALRRPEKITQKERKILIETYKEEIRYLDNHIFILLNHINKDNTIIIITADHGDLFGEHNLFGHTLKLYNGLLHVPLLIKLPKKFNCKNYRIVTPVRLIDLVPTLVEMLNLKTSNAFYGSSFLSLIQGKKNRYQCDYIISEVSRKHLCVQKDGWKLIVDYKNNKKELYNLTDDYMEQFNVIEGNNKIAEKLELIIQEHLVNHKPTSDTPSKKVVDEEIKSRLKALGYID